MTKTQIDRIKNAKTKEQAAKACDDIIADAWNKYTAIELAASEAYDNWEPDYKNMTKEELIGLLKVTCND